MAQIAPAYDEVNPIAAKSESQRLTKEVKRRLKAVQPKGPRCITGAYDRPFPEEVIQIFTNSEISVFAYPNTYTCDVPVGDKIICDVDDDSLYFIRKGEMGAKMSLLGQGKLKARFGDPSAVKCR